MKGISPTVLKTQVEATAAWSLDSGLFPAQTVRAADVIEADWKQDRVAVTYLRLLLSAHFLTVGTFCPTDVDARIRHHYWSELSADKFGEALAEVDRIAGLDPRPVSARVVVHEEHTFSGHDGEWFSVRAGALGRAIALRDERSIAQLTDAIEAELAREAALFHDAVRSGDVAFVLRAVTVLAHNTGDLSRVVEAWPRSPDHAAIAERYARLGHVHDRARFGDAFYVAGVINKKVTAIENHRFLALREPRELRKSRDYLLPIGPFFDAWGRVIARALDESDRAEVVAALLETHLRGPDQQGVFRALAGIAEAMSGPWDRLIRMLPARLRKVATSGAVPAGMRVPEPAFLARLDNRYRAALREAEAG